MFRVEDYRLLSFRRIASINQYPAPRHGCKLTACKELIIILSQANQSKAEFSSKIKRKIGGFT